MKIGFPLFITVFLVFGLSCYPQKIWKSLGDIDWQREIKPLGKKTSNYLIKHRPWGKKVILTDFVYVEDLKPHQFGFLLRNLLASELTQRGIQIKEVEFAQRFKLTPQGFTVMTRSIKAIRERKIEDNIIYAVIGSYEVKGGYIYILTRIFNLQTNTLEKMFVRTVNLTTWQLEYP